MAQGSVSGQYVLGIDLGTTSVKAVLLETKTNRVTDSQTRQTKADISSDTGIQAKEQDAGRIVDALNECIAALPKYRLQGVIRIGVSGQMHGVVFWKAGKGCDWLRTGECHMFQPIDVSPLITWQDGRCTREFLSSLPLPDSHLSLATGFGCTTVFWYLKHRPDFLTCFTAAGTIQDYVVTMLCGQERPMMSVQNAASWGYFNTKANEWNEEILRKAGFPVRLLPRVVESGSIAGETSSEWHGVPAHTPVGVALGDFQCSVYSCMVEKTDAVLNISTSAQLTFALPPAFQPSQSPDPSSPLSYFPYFDGSYLAVAGSLNGGNVLATFVGMVTEWIRELGLDINSSTIYTQSIQAALNQHSTDLLISPTIFGERHAPDHLGSASSISAANVSLGHMTRALCRGIVQNLLSMLPPRRLQESGVQRIMGSGNALSRNEVLKQEVEKAFPLPVVYGKDVDSAVGVAMILSDRI